MDVGYENSGGGNPVEVRLLTNQVTVDGMLLLGSELGFDCPEKLVTEALMFYAKAAHCYRNGGGVSFHNPRTEPQEGYDVSHCLRRSAKDFVACPDRQLPPFVVNHGLLMR